MSPKFNRKAWKEGIKKRQQDSFNQREDTGKFKPIFLETISRDKFWKPIEGEHQINIIPFIAGKNNPNVKEGEPTYVLDIWVHSGIGVNEDNYVCPARNYDLPCPICEQQNELRKDPDYDEDLVKSLSPKRRVVYNIECLDSPKEQNKGIQIFEVSHFSFEKPLMERSKLPKGGGFVYFADVDDGQIVSFDAKKGSFTPKGKKTITKLDYVSFQFIPRDSPISDELLSKTFCLDEIIKIPTYEELSEAFFQESKPELEKEEKESESKEKEEENKEEPGDIPEPEVPEGTCPLDQKFGEDFDNFQECDDCPVRDSCKEKKNELSAPKKPTPKEKEKPTEKPPIRRRPGR
jgi:hypothetical protein